MFAILNGGRIKPVELSPQGGSTVDLMPLSLVLQGAAVAGVGVSWVIAQVPVVAANRFPWESLFAMLGTVVTGYYAMRTAERAKHEKKDRIIQSLKEQLARKDEKLESLKLRHPMDAIDLDKPKKPHADDSREDGGAIS